MTTKLFCWQDEWEKTNELGGNLVVKMRNMFTIDGIFKKERENCLQWPRWTFTVKTCSLNSSIIYLHGKWPMDLQHKAFIRELDFRTSVAVLTGQCLKMPWTNEVSKCLWNLETRSPREVRTMRRRVVYSRNNAIGSNMDGPRGCHTERSQSDREGEISDDIPYMWDPNSRYKWI